MDINDLLYTNKFISNQEITPQVIEENSKRDGYFQRHLRGQNNVKKYRNQNLRTNDQININKNLVQPWPAPDRKNPQPVLSAMGQDIISDKYLVEKKTVINIDSRDRDITLYNICNNYQVLLPRVFNNISNISIKSIQMPNSIPPVNETNNLFSWIIPTYSDIFLTRQVYSIYPFLKSVTLEQINAGMVPFRTYFNETPSTYNTAMLYGFYNTIQFRQQFLDTLNTTPRYETDAISQVFVPDSSNYNHFYMSLNPATHHVSLVNRFYISPVLAVQTFGPRSTSSNDDIFYHFKETTFGTFDPNAVYILVQNSQLQDTFDNIHTNPTTDYLNVFPIVCSDLKRIGGMPSSGLNLTNFFSFNLKFVAPVNQEHNYYKIYDKLKINNQVYYRFQLYVKNLETRLIVAPTFTETQIFNPAIASVVNVSCRTSGGSYTCSINPDCYVNNYSGLIEAQLEDTYSFPNFGFAYPYQFNYEGVNADDINKLDPSKCINSDGTVNTILRLLGWPIIENNALVIQPNGPIKFIQRNIDNILDSLQNFSSIPSQDTYKKSGNLIYTPNILPQRLLPIEKLPSGEYIFRSAPYIFLRVILPDINVEEYPVTLIKPYGGKAASSVDIYYKNPAVFQNFISSINDYFLIKDVNFLTAKIPLNVVATNNITTPIENAEMNFQDKYVNNVSNLIIHFLDYTGKIINPRSDHSFVIEITEIHTVLKDTKQDSRINIVNTNGYVPTG
jgi:hypothetical protein